MTETELEKIKDRWCQVDLDMDDLMAEVVLLNYEIMGYQVQDGYEKGYEHGRAWAVAEVLALRSQVGRSVADPVGLSDIAIRLGVAQQTAKQWKLRGLLPEPKWTVGGRPAWDWPQIEKWAEATGRL